MTDSEQDSKHHSAAKKELRSKLCQQMEFYFSDSNLTKDRFLKKEIENSPNEGYIDLSVFLNFNKIRSLTSDVKQIVKSLKHSELLEINENEIQIRRKVPFVEPNQKDVDKRTIYIEDLPINKANNEAIKTHFEQFGKVCYISMPKFKTSSQSKGFAFIEFEDKSGAKTAIEHYDKLTDGKVYDHTTIGKFPRANAQVKTLDKKIANLNIEISELETELNPAKTELLVEDKSKEALKKRPHKEEKMEVDEHPDQDEWAHLKVISKKAWLQLRDDFLNRQKQEINDLKTQLAELTEKADRLRAEKENMEKKKVEESAPQHERGCIIKLVLDSNNDEHFKLLKMTRQQFKEAMLKDHLDSIAYVDVEKTSNRVLVRCKSAETAQKLLADEKFLTGFQRTLLDGKQEEEYFDKIEASRNKKMEKKERKDNKGHKNENQSGIIKKERLNEKPSDEASNTDRKKLKVEPVRVTQSGSKQHIIFDD